MLLRSRISLFVIAAFAVICVGLALASFKREELIKTQYSDATIADQSNLWRKITDQLVLRMADKAWIAAEDGAFRDALQDDDREEIQRLGANVAAHLRGQGIADRFDALHLDGSLAYSSHTAVFRSPIIAERAARDAIAKGERVRGIGNDKQRNIAIVLGIPLRGPDGVVGMGVYATDIDEAIAEMERVTHSSVLIVNRRGRLLAGSASELWEGLADLVNVGETDTLQNVEAGERTYSTVVIPQRAALGNLVARVVTIRDVTEFARQQRQVGQITVGAVLAFLALMLVSLSYYMSRSFAPLTEGVGVLSALSRGNLQVQIEGADDRDEVGRIAGAVNVFRTNLVAFDRLRRSRERRRRRQERFIRREMTQLADTLDKEERQAVLAELDQLEHLFPDAPKKEEVTSIAAAADDALSPARESDGLATMALAFQKMSDRVQDQNQRLREALKAKDAFVALQRELDIASRVQLSFLPDSVPPSDAFDMAGSMKPAKEVGGDFYDFFRLDSHRVGIVIADVSGKGVPAALFMATTCTLLQAIVQYADTPGRVLASVNDFLEQNNDEQLFVTIFYGVLDERTGRFTYANGGHNPPILSDGDGVRTLEITGGMLLAMFGGIDYAETHVDLEPGARLVLYTDGVTEAFNADLEEFGERRLMDCIRAFPEQGPERDMTDLLAAVEAFAGEQPQSDDITCVVLRFRKQLEDRSSDSA